MDWPIVQRLALLLALAACWAGGGCASRQAPAQASPSRPFVFPRDTLAFANELQWEYRQDPASGQTTHVPRIAPPEYTLHCTVMVRAARQFFAHARFDPSQPALSEAQYRALIRQVMARSARGASPEVARIEIPGYADLHSFSLAQERLLKEMCGGAIQSYFQRGNWRLVFPFTKNQSSAMAERLAGKLAYGWPPVVHIATFPRLSINHSLLLYGCQRESDKTKFLVYDPNQPGQPTELIFDAVTRQFSFPANRYFSGGPVKVYEIFSGPCF